MRSGEGEGKPRWWARWLAWPYRLRWHEPLGPAIRRDLLDTYHHQGLPWITGLLTAGSLAVLAAIWSTGQPKGAGLWAVLSLSAPAAGWLLHALYAHGLLGRGESPAAVPWLDGWAVAFFLHAACGGVVWAAGAVLLGEAAHASGHLEGTLGTTIIGLLAGIAWLGRHLLGVALGFALPAAGGFAISLALAEPVTLHDGLAFLVVMLAGVFIALAAQSQGRALTSRERLEAARALIARLELAEVRQRLFLSHGAALILALGPGGVIVEHTPASLRLLGYRPGGLNGRPLTDLIHPADAGRLRRALAEVEGTQSAHVAVLRMAREDGGWRPVTLALRRVAGRADGMPPGMPLLVVTVQDATDFQDAVQSLRHTRDRAEASVRAKDTFLAVMSHEIRTPMAGIIGLIDLLKATALDSRQAGYVAALDRAGEHLGDLLNDILDLSRIEAGKLHVERSLFDLRKMLGGVMDIFRARAQTKGIALRASVAPDLPRLWLGDERHLRQVVANLIGNAVKFTADGWVEVRVGVAAPPPSWPGARVTVDIAVADSGPGIDPARLPTLFDPFSPAAEDAPSAPAGDAASRGTGLGLAISRRLVGAMGGELTVRSRPGQGSVFTIALPLDVPTAEEVAAVTPSPASGVEGGAAASFTGLRFAGRVLVVDDSDLNRMVLHDMLTALGLEVSLCADGAEAVSAFRGGAFALVILDMQMPGVDGCTAATAMRAIEADGDRPRCPILALSAGAAKDDRDRAMAAGCDGYAVKPLRRDALISLLARVLPAGTAAAPPLAPPPAQAAAAVEGGEDGAARLGVAGNLAALLPTFFQHLTADLQAIRGAVARRALPEAAKAAHTAKGNAMLFGFTDLIAALRGLEADCASGASAVVLEAAVHRVETEAAVLRQRAGTNPSDHGHSA